MLIKVHVETGFTTLHHSDVVEIPDAEWNQLSPKEQEDRLEEEAREFMGNCIDYYACVMSETGN